MLVLKELFQTVRCKEAEARVLVISSDETYFTVLAPPELSVCMYHTYEFKMGESVPMPDEWKLEWITHARELPVMQLRDSPSPRHTSDFAIINGDRSVLAPLEQKVNRKRKTLDDHFEPVAKKAKIEAKESNVNSCATLCNQSSGATWVKILKTTQDGNKANPKSPLKVQAVSHWGEFVSVMAWESGARLIKQLTEGKFFTLRGVSCKQSTYKFDKGAYNVSLNADSRVHPALSFEPPVVYDFASLPSTGCICAVGIVANPSRAEDHCSANGRAYTKQNFELVDRMGITLPVVLWTSQWEEKLRPGSAVKLLYFDRSDYRDRISLASRDTSQIVFDFAQKKEYESWFKSFDKKGLRGISGKNVAAVSASQADLQEGEFNVEGCLRDFDWHKALKRPLAHRCSQCNDLLKKDMQGEMVCEVHGMVESKLAWQCTAKVVDSSGSFKVSISDKNMTAITRTTAADAAELGDDEFTALLLDAEKDTRKMTIGKARGFYIKSVF